MVTREMRVTPQPDCMLCGHRGELAYLGLKDRLFGAPGEWDLHRCGNRDCGLYWLNPMPVAEDISIAYEGYYTHACADEDGEPWGRRQSLLDHWYRVILDLTATTEARQAARDLYLGDTRPGRLLEVGCGDGSHLLRLKALGWEVEGQDIDHGAGAHSLKDGDILVHKAPIEELHLPDNRYDAIVMNHVIEHAVNPHALLRECRRLLKREGQLVLVTPNALSFGHLFLRARWMHLDPPRHLFLFSVRSLPALVRKAGFSRVDAWSSAANAGSVGVVSWDILTRGRHKMDEPPTVIPRLVGVGFQIAASLAIKIRRNCGEEVVLRAWK